MEINSCLEMLSKMCRSPAVLGLDSGSYSPSQSTPKSKQKEPLASAKGWKCGSCPNSPLPLSPSRHGRGATVASSAILWHKQCQISTHRHQASLSRQQSESQQLQLHYPSLWSSRSPPSLPRDRYLCPQLIFQTGKQTRGERSGHRRQPVTRGSQYSWLLDLPRSSLAATSLASSYSKRDCALYLSATQGDGVLSRWQQASSERVVTAQRCLDVRREQ